MREGQRTQNEIGPIIATMVTSGQVLSGIVNGRNEKSEQECQRDPSTMHNAVMAVYPDFKRA